MSEKVLCEKCGAEMRPIDPNKPVGMTCPKCGWGWATSYIDPIVEDAVNYTVVLLDGNISSREVIKTISGITGTNFLQAKKMIENAPAKVFVGKAVAVRNVLNEFKASSISYKVDPPFPYGIHK